MISPRSLAPVVHSARLRGLAEEADGDLNLICLCSTPGDTSCTMDTFRILSSSCGSLSLFFSFFQSPKFTSTFTAWNVVTARLLMYTTYKQIVTGMRELASAARTHLGSLHIKTLLFIPFISKIITVALSPRHNPSW